MKLKKKVIVIGGCKDSFLHGEETDMKILHINSYYNGSNFYKNLYDKQKESGLDIDVYVPVPVIKAIDSNKSHMGDYTIVSVNHNKCDRFFFHIKHNKIYKDITNIYSINNHSIVHAHSLFSNGYIAYKINREYGIPYVVAVRNTDINLFFAKMLHLRNIGINILKNAEKIIFISESYKRYTIDKFVPEKFKKEIMAKSIVIPNGIDEFWMQNKFKERIASHGKRIKLIYVGIIDDNKNIGTTTKACEILIRQGYEVTYTIVGKIMSNKYGNFIKKHSFIEHISHCRKEDLINYYRNSDIFVMPSKHETFGLVYAEAISQGLPVIYTREQGFDKQFVDGEVGYPVQYNSADEIVDRVKDILSNYINISNNCLEQVDRFCWDKIAKKYLEIYKWLKS